MWKHKFRVCGVLLGLLVPVLLYVAAVHGPTPDKSGYGFMFGCYLPVFVLGMPWSLLAALASSAVPGADLIGIVASFCLNAYLAGWLIDAVVNHVAQPARNSQYEAYHRSVQAARRQKWVDERI